MMGTCTSGTGPHIWISLLPAATALCIAIALASSDGATDAATGHEGGRVEPFGDPDPVLNIAVNLIAGSDGGPLRAGRGGWVFFSISNPGKQHLYVSMVGWKGLVPEPKPDPSYRRDQWPFLKGHYAGFGVAETTIEFLDSQGKAVHQVALGPPDKDGLLPPGSTNHLCRPITAPDVAGTYAVRIRLDTSEAVAAQGTWGGLSYPWNRGEFVVKDMRLTAFEAETTVQGVRVVGTQVGATGK